MAEKTTFALIPGSIYESRLFGKKKSTPSENRAIKLKSSFWRKKLTSSKHRGIKFNRLFGGKNVVCTYTRVYIRESTFWQKKVDPIEKPGYEVKIEFLAGKSRLLQNTGGYSLMEFLARKNTFALIPGSKYKSRLFSKKKSTPSKDRAMK